MGLDQIEIEHSAPIDVSDQAYLESSLRELVAKYFGDQLDSEADDIKIIYRRGTPSFVRQLIVRMSLPATLDLGIGEAMYGENLALLYRELVERFPDWAVSLAAEGG